MKKIKDMKSWLEEYLHPEQIKESEVIVDIMLDDETDKVEHLLKDAGVEIQEAFPFGVIKGKVSRFKIETLKKIKGVESIEIIKK